MTAATSKLRAACCIPETTTKYSLFASTLSQMNRHTRRNVRATAIPMIPLFVATEIRPFPTVGFVPGRLAVCVCQWKWSTYTFFSESLGASIPAVDSCEKIPSACRSTENKDCSKPHPELASLRCVFRRLRARETRAGLGTRCRWNL